MNFRSRSPLVQPVMMRGSVQGFGFGFPDIEEQSMLAAKTGAKAKTVSDGFRKGCSAPTAADSIHEIGNGLMELMNYSSGLSKQKHRSVYSCSSRADHTILFHLEYILSAAMISDLVRCWFSGDAWFGSRFWFWFSGY